jgi:hypothetical protein
MNPQSSPQWSQHSPQIQHSNHLEGRVVRLEVSQEMNEDFKASALDRMKWLERGLQSVAVIVLMILTRQVPSSAAALADILLAIIKR